MGWVHKGICSTNVLIAGKSEDHHLGPAFLCGFDYSRRADGKTTGQDLRDWTTSVYVHPTRLAKAEQNKGGEVDEVSRMPATRFSRSHDLYSLGVLLLEVGMWKLVEDQAKSLGPGKTPEERRNKMLEYAKTRLPTVMGSRYADVVLECLNGGLNDDVGDVINRLLTISV